MIFPRSCFRVWFAGRGRLACIFPGLFLLVLVTGIAGAFPPAPYYTLYGMVRDQVGQSNLLEYIAGTFAGDATETFGLTIKEKLPASVRFEFYAITGKVYTIESTLDMKTWTRVPFAVGAPGAGNNAYQASDVGIVSAFTAPRSGSSEFYRLSVR